MTRTKVHHFRGIYAFVLVGRAHPAKHFPESSECSTGQYAQVSIRHIPFFPGTCTLDQYLLVNRLVHALER
jgi:hypothetical protein